MTRAGKRTIWKARAWTAALAVALVASATFASAAQALPANFWGIVPQAVPSEEQFQRLGRGGVESVRIPVDWGQVQPAQGPINWSEIDALVKRTATSGLDVLPFLTGAPSWAVAPRVVDSRSGFKAPSNLPVRTGRQRIAWTAFLAQAVARYGPRGSLWAENPALPRHPIRNWQIWNEPNFKYFVARPNPAEYGKLVKLSYTAIKAADPGAKVILGGLFAEPGEALPKTRKPPLAYFATDFLELMYERTPGIKSKFNGAALHPYTDSYQRLAPGIEQVRAVMAENHDAAKALWITELGWSSQPPNPSKNIFAKGPAGQVTQLKGAFSMLERNQAKWRIQRLYWFSVDDQKGVCNFCDGSGLFSEGFVPKKSWFAYVKFAGGTPN